ncbi:hypothetical protein [Streptomyces sp. NPDC058092]|uniref:hypothetical protein n=1 Tax=Streptomyces sp. NPDC058092 TaxID=3346336 RepID=UPI0036E86272
MKRAAFFVLGLALVVVLLTGCDPGPACERYETHTTIVTTYNGTAVSVHPVITTTCVEYASE